MTDFFNNTPKPRLLITGGTGFVGRNLILNFHSKGYQLKCVFRKSIPPIDAPREIDWVQIKDFSSQAAWENSMSQIDCVIHLAALAHQIGDSELRDADYEQANVIPTEAIANAAARSDVSRLIYISSIAALTSESADLIDENTKPQPDTPYGRSKLKAENSIEYILSESTSCDWVSLRPTLIYGPGNPGNMARISKLIRLPVPLPFGSFDNKRSFLYIENLLSAIEQCLSNWKLSGKRYILCDNQSASTAELTSLIANASGSKKWIISLPSWILRTLAACGEFSKQRLKISSGIDTYSLDKLRASLQTSNADFKRDASWDPPFSLEEGIRKTFKTTNK